MTPPTSNTFPSSIPGEPTINEEAAAIVARGVKASGIQSQRSMNVTSKERTRGRMVGDWQLQKTLGAGSMGKVKLATSVVTKEKVSSIRSSWGISARCRSLFGRSAQ